jgi:hypothetical protein
MLYPETESLATSATARLLDMLKSGWAKHSCFQEINWAKKRGTGLVFNYQGAVNLHHTRIGHHFCI